MDVATCVPLRSWPLHCPQVPPPDAGQDEVLDLCLRRRRDACPPPPASPPPPPPLSPQEQQELVFSPILGAHNKGARPTRPFKAYPKNPLSMAATESLLGYGSSEAYLQFRRRMLEQLQASSGGGASRPAGAARAPGSPLQQPSSSEPAPGDDSGKSAAYWERRRKNNEAAKRSRDARRAKEDELAIRAAFLEQENLKLRYEVTALRTETSKLRYLLFNGTDRPAQPQQQQQQQQQVDLSLSSRWTCRTSPASQQPLIDLAFSNNRKYWSHLDSVFQSYSCTPKPEAKQTVLTLRRSCLRGSIETPVVSPHIVPGGGLFSGPESSRFTNHHSSKG